ncbi:glycyl-radical enzyme activating protein [Caproiciproducens sp. CPB-2]|uniref:glycyl-radical enzyme activating protein n=1 Tax=Caproiciproducens sp. CPB-2 TaxID=3030017 RepID=UPI0023DC9C0B|nr:glycyl-radical enzyme activating protein [Caproiciproducens sp. CPB-2]MDF1494817.1 glycyl-radical enzyme activating protein [Caproiciproducens sp. CPB-2]
MNDMQNTGLLFNIQKFSTNDGPGIRTNIFFKGCPLHCPWCSNPESQSAVPQIMWDRTKCIHCLHCVQVCPYGALSEQEGTIVSNNNCTGCGTCVAECPQQALTLSGKLYTVEEVVQICLQDKAFYEESGGGVTLSGGEPLMHAGFAEKLLRALKSENIHTAIETTGFSGAQTFAQLMPLLDLYLFDCKHYDSKRHAEVIGVPNEQILVNMRTAVEAGKQVIVRIPVIPNFNNSLNDASGFCRVLKKAGANRVNLLPFHQFGEKKYEFLCMPYFLHKVPALHESDLQEFQQVFLDNGFDCYF